MFELMGEGHRFAAVPPDWHVVLTDVKASTQALSNGMHHLVNLVATGSIIAVLNIARRADIAVPFFFGGDGATLIVPETLLAPALRALRRHSENTRRNFNLELRVGAVPIAEIYAHGNKLMIAKAKVSEFFTIPVVLGDGLQYAEKVIKGASVLSSASADAEAALDLEGMECRWDSIKPPVDAQEVLCLLVVSRSPERQSANCSEVLKAMDEIFGPPEVRSPIAVERMHLKPAPGRILREMRAKLGKFDAGYLIENWLRTIVGIFYLRFIKAGQSYLRGVAQLSDTLVIDGRINTIIAGTVGQRMRLVETLDRM